MSLSMASEQTPLLRQLNHGQVVPVNGKTHHDGERESCHPVPSPDKELSNARLALIMGSIWVRNVQTARPEAER